MFRELLEMFLVFFRIGAVTFGGGYAMLPILQRELVDDRGWTTEAELTDYFAIGQCTPGVIAVNTATFIGRKKAGNIGGIVATLGVVARHHLHHCGAHQQLRQPRLGAERSGRHPRLRLRLHPERRAQAHQVRHRG